MKTTSKGMISKIALVFFLAFRACPTVANPELPKLTTSEKMPWSTYAIATTKGLGACVIVNRQDASAPGGIVPVLVTCTHVLAAAPRGPYFIVLLLPVQGANPDIVMLRIDIPPNSEHPYVKHPRRDIAAMEIGCLPTSRISLASHRSLARARWLGKLRHMLAMKFSCSDFPKYSPVRKERSPCFVPEGSRHTRAAHRLLWRNI